MMKKNSTSLLAFAGCFMIASLLQSTALFAQLAANTYQYENIASNYTENSASATSISSVEVDDGTSSPLPIGFTFNYCGVDYTQIVASSNGVLSFDSTISYISTSNSESGLDDIKPALMPLWDDLSGTAGTATYETTGTAPNRVFTLECKNWRWNYSTAYDPTISFEVKLYETSNVIEFIYRQETSSNSSSKSATIGIADGNTPPGYLVLDNTTTNPTASSSTFTTNIADRPATGQIYRFTPVPALDMKMDSLVIATNACSNDSSLISAVVTNLGTATIDTLQVHWSVDGVVQPTVTYTAQAIPNFFSANNTVTIPLKKVFFADVTTKAIKAWTFNPNNLPDMVPENDTATTRLRPAFQGIATHITPGDTTICAGTSVLLDAGQQPAGCIFIWSNGTVTQQTSVSQAGDYNVIVQSLQGCFAYDTVTITERPTPVAGTFGAVDNGSRHFTFTPTGEQNITSYLWDFGDGDTLRTSSNAPQPHQYAQDGTYAVTLTESNTCNAVNIDKQVYVSSIPSGIADAGSGVQNISVYPNPANDRVSINSNEQELKNIVIYNVLGAKVYESGLKGKRTTLPVAALPAGIYQLHIQTNKNVVNRRLEILR